MTTAVTCRSCFSAAFPAGNVAERRCGSQAPPTDSCFTRGPRTASAAYELVFQPSEVSGASAWSRMMTLLCGGLITALTGSGLGRTAHMAVI